MRMLTLNECMRMALRKRNEYTGRCRHYTFVYQGTKLVGFGINKHAEPDKRLGYPEHASLHSELVAYKRARGLLKGGGFDIVNIRLSKSGNVGIAAPCASCAKWLKAVGCKRIYFTTEIGWGYVMA